MSTAKQHKPKVDSNKIHFHEFKIVKGQIDCPEEFATESIEGHNYNIEFSLGFNLEDGLAKADYVLNVSTKSQNKEEAKAVFHLLYIFKVENLNDFTQLDSKQQIRLDHALGVTLASITHSTSRGVFLTRFQGTALQSFTLPVVNPKNLLENPIEAESEE